LLNSLLENGGVARKQTSRACRCDELEVRLERVEELARSHGRELAIQFRRIADLQATVDNSMARVGRRKGDGKGDGKAKDWPHPSGL
jgi:hypothetical protein